VEVLCSGIPVEILNNKVFVSNTENIRIYEFYEDYEESWVGSEYENGTIKYNLKEVPTTICEHLSYL